MVTEGESGWVMQSVVSKAAFRRQPRDGQQTFTVMSWHITTFFQEAWVREEASPHYPSHNAGRARGAAWRKSDGSNTQPSGILEGAFTDRFSNATRPHRCGAQEQCQVNGLMFGFVNLPNLCDEWKVRQHRGFTIPRDTVGLRPRDQSCLHEMWLPWTLSAINLLSCPEEIMCNVSSSRKCPALTRLQKRGRYDDGSDHSLSSLSSVRELILPKAAGATRQ